MSLKGNWINSTSTILSTFWKEYLCFFKFLYSFLELFIFFKSLEERSSMDDGTIWYKLLKEKFIFTRIIGLLSNIPSLALSSIKFLKVWNVVIFASSWITMDFSASWNSSFYSISLAPFCCSIWRSTVSISIGCLLFFGYVCFCLVKKASVFRN